MYKLCTKTRNDIIHVVVGCRCLTELFIWVLSYVEKSEDNNFFVPHSVEQPGLAGKLETSNVSVFDLSHCRIVLKELENFVSLNNKLFGCLFSPFILIKSTIESKFLSARAVTKTSINISS